MTLSKSEAAEMEWGWRVNQIKLVQRDQEEEEEEGDVAED